MNTKLVDFSFIRYANCWEDTALLIGNTKPESGAHILSIASAGDNSLAFLAHAPQSVVAFDINPTQLFLTELKQVAIKHLTRIEVLELLGFEISNKRLGLYKRISPYLSKDAYNYLEGFKDRIENGIIHQGKFENYFRLFRTWFLPLIHSNRTVKELFDEKTEAEQIKFYRNTWNTWRWKLLFKLFFSKKVLGKYGRDPQFFNENRLPVADTIFKQAERHLQSTYVFKNYYLDYQLRGSFVVQLPYYLRVENFEAVKKNIEKLSLFKGGLTDIPANLKFDIMNLSNIFEYMDEATFKKQIDHIALLSNEKSKVAYWNLLVKRDISVLDNRFENLPITGIDLCFFYQSFNLNSYSSKWNS